MDSLTIRVRIEKSEKVILKINCENDCNAPTEAVKNVLDRQGIFKYKRVGKNYITFYVSKAPREGKGTSMLPFSELSRW